MTNVYGNGEEQSDPEVSDSIWTFDSSRLSILEPSGKKTEYTYSLVHDAAGDAIWIPALGEGGWMNYQLDGDGLKLAFYDNLRGRPDGCRGRVKRSRCLWSSASGPRPIESSSACRRGL